jgi:hypothetical protein
VGSSSGLHYEPIDTRKLRTFLGSQTMFTKGKCERFMSKDTNFSYFSFVNIVWDPKNVHSFLIRPDDDPTRLKYVANLMIINE